MITKNTAAKIAYAYADIEAAEKILSELRAAKKDRREPDFRDEFGRARGLQLGVPSGNSGRTLYSLSFELAEIVVAAHIDQKRAEISALCELAKGELERTRI